MNHPGRALPPAESFFLQAAIGQRYCLYHPPHPHRPLSAALIYVHPFAEELNKSRRIAALQARALAAAGVAVLQIDLHGCGDSSGDFADATWAGWKDDLALARDWLAQRVTAPIGFWGLRLGALLALDFAREAAQPPERLLLWQPVIDGGQFLTQFLRLRLASEMLRGEAAAGPASTAEMRAALAAGTTLEVAGYELSPELAASIDALKLSELAVPGVPAHWFELVSEPGQPLPPAAARIAGAWAGQGIDLHVHPVVGERFWMSPEIAECPALLAATTTVFHAGAK